MEFLKEVLLTVLIALVIYFAMHAAVQAYEVFNISMLPTVQPGDLIMVNKMAYQNNGPQRGDIIVFYSARHNENLIKRVIAIPGDVVEIKGGYVYINNVKLHEPYILESPSYLFFESVIPENNYFVLGDDRNNSDDSHNGWTVPRNVIIGKAWLIYWPFNRWQLVQSYSSYTSNAGSSLNMALPCATDLVLKKES